MRASIHGARSSNGSAPQPAARPVWVGGVSGTSQKNHGSAVVAQPLQRLAQRRGVGVGVGDRAVEHRPADVRAHGGHAALAGQLGPRNPGDRLEPACDVRAPAIHGAANLTARGCVDLACGEVSLQTFDHVDRGRVDAREHREVERDQVAQQDAARAAARCGSRPRLCDARASRRRVGSISSRGQLDALAHARMQVVVVEEDGGEARLSARPAQPTISLWSSSGSSWANAGSLAFSLIWRLPAVGDRRRQPGAGDQRDRAVQRAGELLGRPSLGPSGPHSAARSSSGRRRRRSRRAARARRRTAPRPRARRRSCSRRPRAAAAPPGTGSPGTPSARAGSASAPPVVATIRRAPSAPAAS